jgi:hypothetical protein
MKDFFPKIAATRSKFKSPTRPQFKAPITVNTVDKTYSLTLLYIFSNLPQ